jgi:hypothetical protein
LGTKKLGLTNKEHVNNFGTGQLALTNQGIVSSFGTKKAALTNQELRNRGLELVQTQTVNTKQENI